MSDTPNLRRSTRLQMRDISKNIPDTNKRNNGNDSPSESSLTTFQSDIELELHNIQETILKSNELFSSKDVSGQQMYGFQTYRKKNAMAHKASLCQKPSAPVVPRLLPKLTVVIEKLDTKYLNSQKQSHSKKNSKDAELASNSSKNLINNIPSSESESISEDSDFTLSDNETDSESEDSESETVDSNEEDDNCIKSDKSKLTKKIVLNTPKRQSKRYKTVFTHDDYHMKTDEYFETQSEKGVTSDHTLGKLRNPRLTEEKLQQLLRNENHITQTHKRRICQLTENCISLFPMWHFILEEGYSLLLYGLGSKRALINSFHSEVLINHPTLVVNGFFPSLTVKDILDGIIIDLLNLASPTNATDCIDLIKKVLTQNPSSRLYLLVHNIDGIMLRPNKLQDIISCLASIPNLHILASVDHINAPLMWDHVKRSNYNFYWWDATTFLPYQEETSYESSLLVQQSGSLALSSLHNVFLSLTSNARSIYMILVKFQLENGDNHTFAGMAFKDLYRSAREGFLVSSDLALRAQLTEFIDHKLVKIKRNTDGIENLVIPLNKGLLKEFLKQHE